MDDSNKDYRFKDYVACVIRGRRPEWDAKVEHTGGGIMCVIVTVKPAGCERELTWGTANEQWGASISADGEYVENQEVFSDLDTSVDSDCNFATTVADAIIEATEQYIRNYEAIAKVDLDDLAHKMVVIAETLRDNDDDPNYQEIVDVDMWQPVLEAFPTVKTGDCPIDLTLSMRAALEDGYDSRFAQLVRQSLDQWLSSNLKE